VKEDDDDGAPSELLGPLLEVERGGYDPPRHTTHLNPSL